jgi:hypothetical protein
VLIFVYPEQNIILQLLDHFEAHTLPFSTRFKQRHYNFVQNFATWKTHTNTRTTLFLRNEKEQWQKHCISNLFFHFIKHSWFWSVDILRMFLTGWGCPAVQGRPLKFHAIISVFMDELLNKVRYMLKSATKW